MEYSCVWDVWILLYCIYLVLDISSPVPGCFVSRICRGDAVSLSVNVHGGGWWVFWGFFVCLFVFSTKFIMKSSAKIL